MAPRLTVVVPLYNVEEYLGACLTSLAEQTMADLEVVLVDDGSTDNGPALAQEFADRDPRFRLIRQENAGLGAARNAGVRAADPKGEFLTFVDSDDVVPPGAYARMLAELDGSGSDFATGNVLRLRGNGALEQSPMFRKPMEKARPATHVTRDWILLGDRIACNKVFRRTFWDEHAFAFPTGVLYEDIAVVLPAHFLARSVDVVEEPVYHWRDRDGSITTRRAVPQGIRDRVTAVTAVSIFLAGRPDLAEAKRRYDAHALSGDLWLFIEALPDGDEEFHTAFLDHAGAFAATVAPEVFAGLPLDLRVKWQLIRERRIAELLALLGEEKNDRDAFHVRGLLRPRAHHPAVRDPLPPAATALTPADLPVHAHLTEAVWRDGLLRLTGYAYVRNAPGGPPRLGWLRSGKRLIPLRLRPRPGGGDEATARSGRSLHRYARAGFEAVVDPRAIAAKGKGKGGRTTWKLESALFGAGRLRRGPMRLTGTPAPPAALYTDERTRVVPVLSGNKLELRTERIAALLTGHSAADDSLHLDVKVLDDDGPAALRLTEWRTKDIQEFALRGSLGSRAAEIPLSAFRGKGEVWGVQLVGGKGKLTVAARTDGDDGRYPIPGGRELYVAPNPSGDLVLTDRAVQPVVTSVSWTEGGELVLEGVFPEPSGTIGELVLRHSGHHEEAVIACELEESGSFRAVVHPAAVDGSGGPLPLAEGRWYLFLREPGERDPDAYRPLRLATPLHADLPLQQEAGGRPFTLQRRHHDRLVLESGSALPVTEQGPYGQRIQRERYATLRAADRGQLRPAALYSSFDGRQHSDSPRAIHRELASRVPDIEHLWTVRDQQAAVPEGVRAIALHSAEWYEALARSRWVVTNTHLPQWFERAEGQCVVQTWHGTPLKRIGRDLAGSPHADAAYMASMEHRSAQWSLLVSPNSFSTPVLRRAFGYSGEVLECGYPRNDLLYAPDRAKVATAVRERLAIPEGRRVILYAPTWREDQPRRAGRYDPDLQLDLDQAREDLGGDHVLLVRRHYLVGGSVPDTDFVRDVSRHQDVAELLLISDVLVTDYSSIMFDFAQTGRPMLFHTYDLAHYRDTLRGFCFDFEHRAPGPLIPDSAGVVAALRDPEAAVAGHGEAYERFREAFCDLDDGSAAARVVDRMLKEGPWAEDGPGGGTESETRTEGGSGAEGAQA
ncbi:MULTISPECIES: bifunctional glycosyltransferase/CDP-glycerol:glycerophosphate glycerophosphotransferase [unclassified Streptomyces]|uniref:bifunctional glycosyltransferase/CDP-glycerol:glycerophosphate glycerophosphotransferase n=1 Tax=unclassified Streptomyces TaxID=2593676 RepID=UPI00081DC22C|nr:MULTISPECIES: bifunctional glycosyltransferase/CDP-glycerol:glycerophosphate glycerophosphotransferase [unclassified Streptomyces]SCD68100.1 CDP-glycerol glycerophosphotransferase [Streptomyces sp. ScaeMP-e83]